MRTARPAWAAWLREQGVVAIDDVDTRALVRRIRADGVLRCAVGDAPVEELHARALARAADRRAPARPAASARTSRTSSAPARGSSLVDLGCKRSIPRRLAAAGVEVAVVPGDWDADAILELEPRAVLVGNGPGDPAVLARPDRDGARAARPRAALRHLPRPPAARPRARASTRSSSRSATAARTIPCATRAPAACSSPCRTTASPCEADEYVSHVSLNDGTVEGLAGEDFATRAVPSRGGARPARRAPVLRPGGRGMPRRADLRSILIIGSGPIRIGQGCEFDYSASQACRVLRREGLRVVLVNSNPATIMTDPEWADATYIEPLDLETVDRGDRGRAARRAPADARRPDRAQPRRRAARGRRARASTASSCSAHRSTRSAAPRTGCSSARRWSPRACRCPAPR